MHVQKGLLLAVLTLGLGTSGFAQVIIDTTNFSSIGEYDAPGDPNHYYTSNPNTFTTGYAGGYDDEIHQGYVVFSTSGVSAPVSALLLTVNGSGGTITQTAALNFYLYTSNTAPTADSSSFASSVSGDLIGSYTLPIGELSGSFQLNSTGLQAFNNAVANHLTFALTTQLTPDNGASDNAGAIWVSPNYVELQATSSDAPEPRCWVLLLGGVIVLVVRRISASGSSELLW